MAQKRARRRFTREYKAQALRSWMLAGPAEPMAQ